MKILMSAYACEPGGGSENGVGWALAAAAATDHQVWVVTRENNREAIEAELARRPELRLTPITVDLPSWASFWKRGLRGHRAYYLLWQRQARREMLRLHAEIGFDLAHHATFASDSFAAGALGIPGLASVWGPVGGSQTMPWHHWRHVGTAGLAGEVFRTVTLGAMRRVWGRRNARRADLVVALNDESARSFADLADVVVRPNVALELDELPERSPAAEERSTPWAVFSGRLIPWKGLTIAVEALAKPAMADWHLEVFGEGPDRDRAGELATELGLAERVHFRGKQPRNDVLQAVADADVLLHPALHDSSPWSVGEAVSMGTPVVCLDLGGPPLIVGSDGGVAVPVEGDLPDAIANGYEIQFQ